MKQKKKLLFIIIPLLIAALFFGMYRYYAPTPLQGTKAYQLTVIDDAGSEKSYSGKTDAEYLSGLMDELSKSTDFSYEGDTTEYGLYITSVNGLTADYDKDQAYWSILVNGEYGQYGADAQTISDGDTFALVYESMKQ